MPGFDPGVPKCGEAESVRILFLIGVALLLLAFLAMAAGMMARFLPGGPNGLVIAAWELWATLAPDSLDDARAWAQVRGGTVGRGVLDQVLAFPAWVLTGLPGLILAWLAHPRHRAEADPELASVFLYDELAQAARDEARNPPPFPLVDGEDTPRDDIPGEDPADTADPRQP